MLTYKFKTETVKNHTYISKLEVYDDQQCLNIIFEKDLKKIYEDIHPNKYVGELKHGKVYYSHTIEDYNTLVETYDEDGCMDESYETIDIFAIEAKNSNNTINDLKECILELEGLIFDHMLNEKISKIKQYPEL
jgi:hypothetical protein